MKLLRKAVLTLVALAVAYLVLVNLALNLPLTQKLINDIRPEKFAVSWERAWSLYPLRLGARGVSANGQTRTQQWQAEAGAISASMAVLPLMGRTISISGVGAENLHFLLRPRPKPDKDYARIRDFFPEIQGRDATSPAEPKPAERKPGKPWKILVENVYAKGEHEFWIRQMRGTIKGGLGADLAYETRGGPFSMKTGVVDLELKDLTINDGSELASGGTLKGELSFAPFIPSDNPGVEALGFLSLAADLDAQVGSLRFLDFYLSKFKGIQVDGSGRLSGHVSFRIGNLKQGTDLKVAAKELELDGAPYKVTGDGGIRIHVDPEDPETLAVDIKFGDLRAGHGDDETPLITGAGLEVSAQGSPRVVPDGARKTGSGRLSVSIPSVDVEDLKVYQRYVPDKWGVALLGGKGRLQGEADFSASAMSANLSLESEDADISVKGYRFSTDLDLALAVKGDATESPRVDISGTYVLLNDAQLGASGDGASEPWSASFNINQGRLGLELEEGESPEVGFKRLGERFNQQGFKSVVAAAEGELDAALEISDLGWVNLLFKDSLGLKIAGSGGASASLRLRQGWLDAGSELKVQPRDLKVQFLDYVVWGGGALSLKITRGGERPDLRLDAVLSDAKLKRQGETDTVVEQVNLELSGSAAGIDLNGGGNLTGIDLRIPSARVTDATAYNAMLPPNAPLKLLGGQADLKADVRLKPESAVGTVKFSTKGLRSQLDEQKVTGDLILDVKLQGGKPKDMAFDINGSTLSLEGFGVAGEQQTYSESDWRAQIKLRRGRAVWRKPIKLDLEAEIGMKDSRPIVALMSNQRGKHSWLGKILTVEDIKGSARLKVDAGRALLPYAMAGSDKIDVGAKGVVDAKMREGIFYARFRRLDGILKVRNGERNFDLFGARKIFNAYDPGQSAVDLSVSQSEAEQELPGGEVPDNKAPATDAAAKSSRQEPQEDARGLFSGE
jgi:hypothetical protein